MARRRLTDQQKHRIQAAQDARRQRVRRDGTAAADAPEGAPGDERQGLVVGHYGRRVDVEEWPPQDNAAPAERHTCLFRANIQEGLVAGDRVVWRSTGEGQGVVETVLARRSLLARPDTRGLLKPVAANIDFLVLVIACEPAPSATLIDRYLVAAELQGIDVRLLLNKIDLAGDDYREVLMDMLADYTAAGYQVQVCSAVSGEGMQALDELLRDHISVFVGQSGVGKSSLVNRLLGEERARVGELSDHSRLGKHTTTNAQLFHFPAGGSVIDSPGIREFGLWHLNPSEVIKGYREFGPLLGQCRFSDCRHLSEPGCALKAAAESGEISQDRLDRYFMLLDGLSQR
jgi:ribosome biogenesis GTPase